MYYEERSSGLSFLAGLVGAIISAAENGKSATVTKLGAKP